MYTDEAAIATATTRRISLAKQALRKQRMRARRYLDYYAGNVVAAGVDENSVCAENRIAANVDEVASRIAEARPTPEAIPLNGEDQERENARDRTDLIHSQFDDEGVYTDHVYQMGVQAPCTGAVYLKAWWDPHGGIPYTPNEEEMNQIRISQSLEAEGFAPSPMAPHLVPDARGEYHTGACRYAVLPVHQFGYDPGVHRLRDAEWCYEEQFLPIDVARARWPERAHLLQPDVWFAEDRSSSLDPEDDGQKSSGVGLDRVTVFQYCHKRCPTYPDGMVVFLSSRGVLEIISELPFGVFPYWEAQDRPMLQRQIGLGRVRDQIPLQRELNNRRTRFKSISDKMGGVIIMEEEGTLKDARFIDEDVTSIPYDRGARSAPSQLHVSISPVHQIGINDARQAINEVSRFPEYVHGRMPSGISGRTLGLYDSQIATILGQLARSIGRALTGAAEWTLEAWREYGSPTAMIAVVGVGGTRDAREFSKRAITSTKCRLDEASAVVYNASFRREQVMAMAGSPFMQPGAPPRVRRWFVKQMEFPGVSDLVRDTSAAAKWGRAVVQRLSAEQWTWPLPDPEMEDVVRDVVSEAKLSSAWDDMSPTAQAMMDQYLDWSEWVLFNRAQGAPGFVLRQQMITADWRQPPPVPGQAHGAAPPPSAPTGTPTDVWGPDPAPDGAMPARGDDALLGQMLQLGGMRGMDNAAHFGSPQQPAGPGFGAGGDRGGMSQGTT